MAKFYAACLASYNNGVLHGVHVELSTNTDEMQAAISAMLRKSRFPNVTVIDYEATAIRAGWSRIEHSGMFAGPVGSETRMADYDDWKELCEDNNLELVSVPSAEEWAIHDYEDMPSFGEYAGLQTMADYAELLEEFDHVDEDDLQEIVKHFDKLEYAAEALRDKFAGTYESFKHYAEEQADEMLRAHDIKDDHPLSRYFDYEQYERELKMDMDVVELSSGVAIFYS